DCGYDTKPEIPNGDAEPVALHQVQVRALRRNVERNCGPEMTGLLDQLIAYTRPPSAGVQGWVSCGERRPAKEDGYVWLLYPTGVSQFVWRWDDIGGGEETHWMPTGLKRPQPPREGSGDEH